MWYLSYGVRLKQNLDCLEIWSNTPNVIGLNATQVPVLLLLGSNFLKFLQVHFLQAFAFLPFIH